MGDDFDITVILTTFNRAEILEESLTAMTSLHRTGLSVGFVVVDNNSTDRTKEVVESFHRRLPVRYMFEPKSGKNRALNTALKSVNLGRIVVFTDDDVQPQEDWLKAIFSVSSRWPDYDIFGGRIEPVWPVSDPPEWVHLREIRSFAFGAHDFGDKEGPYPPNAMPFGGNFWVRRKVFDSGKSFREEIGPREGGYIMGSETTFLRELRKEGYDMIYSPSAIIGHRIQPEQLRPAHIRKRAWRYGRGIAHWQGLRRPELFSSHPVIWSLWRTGAVVKYALLFVLSILSPFSSYRFLTRIRAVKSLGYNLEALRIAHELKRQRI